VLAGEARRYAFAVLVDAPQQVRGDAGVEGAVAARGHDVDAGLEVALHSRTLLGSRFRGNDEGRGGVLLDVCGQIALPPNLVIPAKAGT
jgi:hypothetical protein